MEITLEYLDLSMARASYEDCLSDASLLSIAVCALAINISLVSSSFSNSSIVGYLVCMSTFTSVASIWIQRNH